MYFMHVLFKDQGTGLSPAILEQDDFSSLAALKTRLLEYSTLTASEASLAELLFWAPESLRPNHNDEALPIFRNKKGHNWYLLDSDDQLQCFVDRRKRLLPEERIKFKLEYPENLVLENSLVKNMDINQLRFFINELIDEKEITPMNQEEMKWWINLIAGGLLTLNDLKKMRSTKKGKNNKNKPKKKVVS